MTPYAQDGSINFALAAELVSHYIESGCHGIFTCGSSGEGPLLTVDERKRLSQFVLDYVAGQIPVMVHVGALRTDDSVALAQHAHRIGADAVSSIPPFYYRVGFHGVLAHMRAVAEAAQMPTYLYHIPALTGVDLNAEEIVEILTSIPNGTGLKLTYSDLFMVWRINELSGGRLGVLIGHDPLLYQGLCTGADGGIGSTYSYQPETVVNVYRAFMSGDRDRSANYQNQANRVIEVLFRNGGNLSCEKAIMRLLGWEVGNPRRPFLPYPDEQLEQLKRELNDIGFFEQERARIPAKVHAPKVAMRERDKQTL